MDNDTLLVDGLSLFLCYLLGNLRCDKIHQVVRVESLQRYDATIVDIEQLLRLGDVGQENRLLRHLSPHALDDLVGELRFYTLRLRKAYLILEYGNCGCAIYRQDFALLVCPQWHAVIRCQGGCVVEVEQSPLCRGVLSE